MTLVLSSSLGTTTAIWEPVLAYLDGVDALRHDHPGHGGAPVPDGPVAVGDLARGVLELLDREGVERASFCGLSLGGCVGLQLALDAPERLDRLVLVCTSPRFGTPRAWQERADTVRRDGVEAIADAVVDRWFTRELADPGPYRRMLLATDPEGYARCCEAIRDFDVRDALARVAAPTLVVAGSDDPGVGPGDAELLAGGIPGASLHVIPRSAHLAPVERPREFARVLTSHLEAE